MSTRPKYWHEFVQHTKSAAYRERVASLCCSMDHSDAEAVADAEFLEAWHTAHPEEVNP
jgi:hypothetical protein